MNPIPSIPMLSGTGGSGKTLMVVCILGVILMMASQQKTTAAAPK